MTFKKNNFRWTWDIESSNLLNNDTVDYTASPYRLKDTFDMHCIVLEHHDTGEILAFYDGQEYIFDGRPYEESDGKYTYVLKEYLPQEYTRFYLKDFVDFVNHTGQFAGQERYRMDSAVAHNGINFDWLAVKLWTKRDFDPWLNYSVKYQTWGARQVELIDTMMMSKTLNPDRFGGHSLDNLSQHAGGDIKRDFRKEIPAEDRFKTFAADMLYYCIYDNKATTSVFRYLVEEWGDYSKWQGPFELEQRVVDIITRQEHRGFNFNMKQAEHNIRDLDEKMEAARVKVEPILPPKPPTKGMLKNYIPPKNQIKKNLMPSSHMEKFAEKHNGKLVQLPDGKWELHAFDQVFSLPLDSEKPLIEPLVPATLNDTTHIKEWLGSLHWNPSEFGVKDLTTVSGKKIKKNPEQLEKGIVSYVEQTLASNFCQQRCLELECTPDTLEATIRHRIEKSKGRGLKVLTNPKFTKGQEKEMCPNLLAMHEQFPFARDIVEYLTYRHRRNAILGGGQEWEEEDDDQDDGDGVDYKKGFLAYVRADGRIPTPAATCDAATGRMKHRIVANVPRVTSLYGAEMRNLFGSDAPNYFQIGYDFASLEARIEAHYTWRYDLQDKPYCNSLLLEKPHDVHSKVAARITEIIGRKFERTPAKSVKYAVTYGATAGKVAQTIGSDLATGQLVYDGFWQAAAPLAKLKEKLHEFWVNTGKKYILGIDGRKVPTRSPHAILNSLFQSGGIVMGKRAMVIYEDYIEAEGMLCDFFVDDWKNKPFAQQMIAYHKQHCGFTR